MPKLPRELFERRLANEEAELRAQDIEVKREEVWRELELETVAGREKVPVARKYTLTFPAKGYWWKLPDEPPQPLSEHKVAIYVLETYPYVSDGRFGAPIRIEWLSPIFHPNIARGVEAGGNGVVCYRILNEWSRLDTLSSVVRGLRLLIENPDLRDPLRYEENRLARDWFGQHMDIGGKPKVISVEELH